MGCVWLLTCDVYSDGFVQVAQQSICSLHQMLDPYRPNDRALSYFFLFCTKNRIEHQLMFFLESQCYSMGVQRKSRFFSLAMGLCRCEEVGQDLSFCASSLIGSLAFPSDNVKEAVRVPVSILGACCVSRLTLLFASSSCCCSSFFIIVSEAPILCLGVCLWGFLVSPPQPQPLSANDVPQLLSCESQRGISGFASAISAGQCQRHHRRRLRCSARAIFSEYVS